MKTKETKSIFFGILFLLVTIAGIAQNEEQKIRPFQLSFITPLGTNGLDSWNTTNIVSINIFAGFSGGLMGIEMAGFANGLKGDMKGIQMAGFCNNTFGEAEGLEIAGFYNYNHKNVKGMQIAGFTNLALGDVEGAQISGFANHSQGSSTTQIAGFSNTSMGDKGGMQVAGFANFGRGDGIGGQVAGFANVNTGHIKGIQVAGFVNYAKKITGVQVAPFNIADTLENGIAVGVWSIVKNGYKAIQIGGNESLYGEISFKSGVRKFYNIISVGASIQNNQIKWGWGYGVGTIMGISNRFDLSLEAMSYHLNEDQWWSNNSNLLNRLNLTASYQLTDTFSVYAGAAWNVWVTNNRSDNPAMEPTFNDWTVFERTYDRTKISMYPGLNAGVRISF